MCVLFCLACAPEDGTNKEMSCVCSMCCARRTESIQDLKRSPLRDAVGLKPAAGSKKATFWVSLWRQTGKVRIIQGIPPILMAALVMEGYQCYPLFEKHPVWGVLKYRWVLLLLLTGQISG